MPREHAHLRLRLLRRAPPRRRPAAARAITRAITRAALSRARAVLCSTCVLAGVKYISRFTPIFLLVVLLSVLCIWIGIFAAGERTIEDCGGGSHCAGGDDGGCHKIDGITGLSAQNLRDNYGEPDPLYPLSDCRHSGVADFRCCLALFFPSVTGIMAGSNRSGDLHDAQARPAESPLG